jgi:hypothetical protein
VITIPRLDREGYLQLVKRRIDELGLRAKAVLADAAMIHVLATDAECERLVPRLIAAERETPAGMRVLCGTTTHVAFALRDGLLGRSEP